MSATFTSIGCVTAYNTARDIFGIAQQLAHRGLQWGVTQRGLTPLCNTLCVPSAVRRTAREKSQRIVELVHGSPHGAELMDENSRLCGGQAVEVETHFRELVTRAFRRASAAGEIDLARVELSAAALAELFARASTGLKAPGVTAGAYREGVVAFVRVFLVGVVTPHGAVMPRKKRRVGR